MQSVLTIALAGLVASSAIAAPKAILISLDGATPRLMQQYINNNAILPGTGIRLLQEKGVKANQNLTINPSLTAAAHIAIATGSNAAANDIPGNAFRLLATPSTSTFTQSGFGAPIGGYQLSPLGMSPNVTAMPIWGTLRAAPYNKTVVTATWPGGDGVNVLVPGATGAVGSATNPIIQPASERTVDYTVPFGAGTSPFQTGFELNSASFSAAPAQIIADLVTAGHPSFSPALQATLETFTTMGVTFNIRAVALDTTNDAVTNYDTIVIYNTTQGILGPFTPAPLGTGPAYIKPGTNLSALFFLEGNTVITVPQKAGVRYFVSNLAPDLSSVRIARTSVSYIGRQFVAASATQVLADLDDINNNVGFWQPSPDFRIVEKLDAVPSKFANFPDTELEAIYEDLVVNWTAYQKNVVLRALAQKPNADLAMFYFEQPDGSAHQFFLADPRQSTSFTDNTQIGANQDPAKVARYASYLQNAYVQASNAVQAVINAVGVDGNGVPNSNVLVVSDHGFDTFHTAVNLTNLLSSAGVDINKLRVVTTGPAVNIYIRLTGRTPGETVTKTEYLALQAQVANALRTAADTNATFTLGAPAANLFDQVIARPLPADVNDASFGLRTSEFIGQDSGDVFATLVPGYNFDGLQVPFVQRLGDNAQGTTLAAALGGAAANTSLSVSSVAGFPTVNNFLIQIDTEHLLVTTGAGTPTWTVVRAQTGSVRAAHNLGAQVKLLPNLTQPNFYGAHGYDPTLVNMSAIFYAAGPNITHSTTPIPIMANMDVAPTIERLLGVPPAITVQGRALNLGPVPNYLIKAGSRKAHGAAGNFDVPLPLTTTPSTAAVECRRAATTGAHQLVFTFANPVTSGTAGVTAGTGTVGSTSFSGNEMIVNLTGVTDAQNLSVTLSNVNDGSTLVSGSVNVTFLQGDVDGSRTVDATDVNEEKNFAAAGGAVTRTSFRADTVANGATNSSDIAFTKANLGHTAP
ncbi:MAG: alkaline phosphatase family protein [Chthoniobacteraceae bacterium]